jgi:sec-independent protein translocase protein TatC
MNSVKVDTIRKPFIEHLHELRTRLVWCALAIALGVGLGFSLHEKLLALIQKPLGETLYYTSPTGGFNFAFKISLTFGFVLALPVIVYNLLKFLTPLIGRVKKIFILSYLIWSLILAAIGLLFAYIISLPAALEFLTHFGGSNIQALITADEYFNFALAYLGGFALLFQIPLLMLFINRIKPLRPGPMMRAQRYIILGSVVIAAILTPTPDPFNQMIMASPIIVLYQLGIIMLVIVNYSKKKIAKKRHPQPVVRSEEFIAKTARLVTNSLVTLNPVSQLQTFERAATVPIVQRTRKFMDILPPTYRVRDF